jgi:hypothetical protein
MEAVDVRGKFVWHQLMTRDVPGAKLFYSKLAGWKTQAWPLDPNYTVCHAASGPAAGIAELPAGMSAEVPSHWLQYIGTRDVDATAEAAVRAGGAVVKAPGDMQGAGRYAVLKDPQGAVFAILDPEKASPEPDGAAPVGTFSWHELATTDHEAGFAFYSGLFGWEAITRMDMGPAGTYLIFGADGQQLGGIYTPPPNTPMPPNWLPYVSLANADAGFTLATASGAKELIAPMTVPGGGRIAVFFDPAGAAFAVHSMPGTATPTAPAVAVTKSKTKLKAETKVKPKAKAKTKTKGKAKPKAKAKKTAVTKKKAAANKKRPARRVANKPAARKSKSKSRKTVSRRKK